MLKVVMPVKPILQGEVCEDVRRLGDEDLLDGLVLGRAAVGSVAAAHVRRGRGARELLLRTPL